MSVSKPDCVNLGMSDTSFIDKNGKMIYDMDAILISTKKKKAAIKQILN